VVLVTLFCCCLQIQEALKNDLARFQFEGREIKLDPRAGIFITMVQAALAYLRLL
jgi:hypothetical protein